jgi:hypothetical protein
MSYKPEYNVLLAERAAAMSYFCESNDIKLGNEGMCAHFNEIAQLAIASFEKFPVLFDWDISDGRACWDMEMYKLVEDKLAGLI